MLIYIYVDCFVVYMYICLIKDEQYNAVYKI